MRLIILKYCVFLTAMFLPCFETRQTPCWSTCSWQVFRNELVKRFTILSLAVCSRAVARPSIQKRLADLTWTTLVPVQIPQRLDHGPTSRRYSARLCRCRRAVAVHNPIKYDILYLVDGETAYRAMK